MTGKTFVATPSTIDQKWLLVDADGKRLGLLASAVARMLTGKNKPIYTPNIDTGDFVVVVNAEKIELSGAKADKKVELAVKGMLPKNKLGEAMFGKLKVYAGPTHPHGSQSPQSVEIGAKRNG
jgi:large subunit ribosomal protein L13